MHPSYGDMPHVKWSTQNHKVWVHSDPDSSDLLSLTHGHGNYRRSTFTALGAGPLRIRLTSSQIIRRHPNIIENWKGKWTGSRFCNYGLWGTSVPSLLRPQMGQDNNHGGPLIDRLFLIWGAPFPRQIGRDWRTTRLHVLWGPLGPWQLEMGAWIKGSAQCLSEKMILLGDL